MKYPFRKVYEVLIHWSYDSEPNYWTFIFSSYKKALNKFYELIKQELETGFVAPEAFEDGKLKDNYELESYTNSKERADLYWQIYETGFYSNKHVCITLMYKDLH